MLSVFVYMALFSVTSTGYVRGLSTSTMPPTPAFIFEDEEGESNQVSGRNVRPFILPEDGKETGGSTSEPNDGSSFIDGTHDERETTTTTIPIRKVGDPNTDHKEGLGYEKSIDISKIVEKLKQHSSGSESEISSITKVHSAADGEIFTCDFEQDDCMEDMKLRFSFVRTQASMSSTSEYKPISDVNSLSGHYTMAVVTNQHESMGAIKTPPIKQSSGPGTYCLSFWYAMNGRSVGTVGLFFFYSQDDDGKMVWRKSDNQGAFWYKKELTYRTTRPTDYLIVFMANVEERGDGIIALDEIKITEGRCNDRKWSDWGKWGACSVSCGRGTEKRERACLGENCEGPSEEARICTQRDCPERGVWKDWGRWGACSTSCGPGIQARGRECDGRDCDGSATTTRACDTKPCDERTKSLPWGSWGPCSVTCGLGVRSKARKCEGRCDEPSTQTERCQEKPCSPSWKPWGRWSKCSATCGNGERTRVRECGDPEGCLGEGVDKERCEERPCEGEGKSRSVGLWEPWGEWTPCPTTCGIGYKLRIRRCGGSNCRGSEEDFQRCVSSEPCKGTSVWGQWGEWERCPVTCGEGVQIRVRRCDGTECEGSRYDRRICERPDCPESAACTEWGRWSRCAATCGQGVRWRSRDCSDGVSSRFQRANCESRACPKQERPGPSPGGTGELTCGKPRGLFNIIGGEEAAEGAWPWHIALLRRPPANSVFGSSSGLAYTCGGSIVSSRHVITAGHCLHRRITRNRNTKVAPSEITIKAGSNRLNVGRKYSVERVIIHPRYEYLSPPHDIAILVLSDEIQFDDDVQPLCLPPREAKVGDRCYAIGWGRTSTVRSQVPYDLKEVRLEIINKNECRRKWSWVWDSRYMLCAGKEPRTSSTYKGDSGGPLMCEDDGRFYLQGITSLGQPDSNKPGVYTDVYQYLSWIKETMGAT